MSPPNVKLDAMDALTQAIRQAVAWCKAQGGEVPVEELAQALTALALADMASSLRDVAGFCNENFYALTNLGLAKK